MSELLAMSTDEFENHISQYGATDLRGDRRHTPGCQTHARINNILCVQL